jgi:hypothetical protein
LSRWAHIRRLTLDINAPRAALETRTEPTAPRSHIGDAGGAVDIVPVRVEYAPR